ncbi:hypothetical protein CSUI_005262 [Cystoisospora suis]|uniref:Uncharacterized protein n=1 Tax=Cystoisospora suis TaxID=483139 RepID=A0A2C6KVU4_9APIC|nr:hypothetical protein CSUI_005262 [Cystoisospora suis]
MGSTRSESSLSVLSGEHDHEWSGFCVCGAVALVPVFVPFASCRGPSLCSASAPVNALAEPNAAVLRYNQKKLGRLPFCKWNTRSPLADCFRMPPVSLLDGH